VVTNFVIQRLDLQPIKSRWIKVITVCFTTASVVLNVISVITGQHMVMLDSNTTVCQSVEK